MEPNEFSLKLMKLSMDLQNMPKKKQQAFTKLLYATKIAAEAGLTQEQIQLIVVSAVQIEKNPELKQLFSILTGELNINPDDDFIEPGEIVAARLFGIINVLIPKNNPDLIIAPKLCVSIMWSRITTTLPRLLIFFFKSS